MDPIEVFLRTALQQRRVEDRQIRAALASLRPVLSDVDRIIRESGALEPGPARERIIRAVSDVIARQVRDQWGVPMLHSLQEELGPFVEQQMGQARRLVEAAGGTLTNPGAAVVNVPAIVNGVIVNGRPLGEQLTSSLPASIADRAERYIRLGLNDPGVEATFETAVRTTAENAVEATIRSGVHSVGSAAQQAIYQFETDPDWLQGRFTWTAVLDSRTCPVCVGQDGTERLQDTPGAFWDGQRKIDPHLNCVIGSTRIEAGIIAGAMRSTYTGPVVTIGTDGGRLVSLTENHPVLTSHGWKPAKLVEEGDQLICRPLDRVAAINPDLHQAPSTAEETFGLLGHLDAVSRCRVPAAPVDFHGDGVSLQGDVDIEYVNSQLLFNDQAVSAEDVSDALFCVADAELTRVHRLSPLDQSLLALHCAANGIVGSGHALAALVMGQMGPLEGLGFALAARRHPSFDEPLAHSAPCDTELLRDLVFAHAGAIQLDNVAVVKTETKHDLPVYDFSTLSGVYFADGILTHNCRCYLIPSTWRGEDNRRIVVGDIGEQVVPFRTDVESWIRQNPDTAGEIFGKARAKRLIDGEISLDRAVREAT